MTLRREALPPAPRPRRRWDPITVILGLVLIATISGGAYQQRRLQARAEAAEAEVAEMKRVMEGLRLGDFPTPPRPDPWNAPR